MTFTKTTFKPWGLLLLAAKQVLEHGLDPAAEAEPPISQEYLEVVEEDEEEDEGEDEKKERCVVVGVATT